MTISLLHQQQVNLPNDGTRPVGPVQWNAEHIIEMATNRVIGRLDPGTGVAQELSGTQLTTMLDTFTSALKGLVPSSGGGTTNFLRADGTWAPAGSGGSLADGDKGDITVSSSGLVWTIDSGVVTYAKMQQVSIANRVLGRISPGAGVVQELTGTQVTTFLDEFTSSLKGLAPPSGGGTANYLRADGQWVAPPGSGGVSDGDKGDITVSSGGAVWTIDNDVVTYAKMQNVSATNRFLGRISAGPGDTEELTGTQATTLLDAFTSVLKGLAPASGGGTTNFLRADGTWTAPPGTAAGDVVGPASSPDNNVPRFNGVTGKILQTSTDITIDDSGRFIIGGTTAVVNTKLQVLGTSAETAMWLARYQAGATGPVLSFSFSRSGVLGTHTIVQSGDVLSQIESYGSDGVQHIIAGSIKCEVDGTPGVNDMPGRLVFSTTVDGGLTTTERMRIDNLGRIFINALAETDARVRISESNARWGLSVETTGNHIDVNGVELRKTRNATPGSHTIVQADDGIGALYFRASDGAVFRTAALIGASVDGTPGSGDMPGRLSFMTTPDGSATLTERMRIDNAGNVIIYSALNPDANDGAVLGTTVLGWSDLHLASGGTLNWANGNVILTHGTSMFSDALLTLNKDLIVNRNAGFGSNAEIGTKTMAPGGSEIDTLYRYSSFIVNDAVVRDPIFGDSGLSAYIGIRSGGNTVTAEDIFGHNSFAAFDVNADVAPENIGDFSGGLYLASIFGTNFSNTINSPSRNWYYYGMYIGLYDYGSLALPCRSNYTDFVGLQVESQHRGTGTATNVIGARIVAGSGQAGGTTGACVDLTGIDIIVSGTYQSITNARGLRIRDHSGIGASAINYNLLSEGANSFNVFEGYVKTSGHLVGSLISAATAGAGARAFVTDSTVSLTAGIGAVVAGTGGSPTGFAVPVYSDGTNWRIG